MGLGRQQLRHEQDLGRHAVRRRPRWSSEPEWGFGLPRSVAAGEIRERRHARGQRRTGPDGRCRYGVCLQNLTPPLDNPTRYGGYTASLGGAPPLQKKVLPLTVSTSNLTLCPHFGHTALEQASRYSSSKVSRLRLTEGRHQSSYVCPHCGHLTVTDSGGEDTELRAGWRP